MFIAAALDKGNRLFWRDASLLLFKPGIDLNIKLWIFALLFDLDRKCCCDFLAINGFNHIEQS